MKRGRIFVVGPTEGTLTPMEETDFSKEDILQRFLADYPDLLPGDQISPEAPRRWLLIAREMGVPDTTNLIDRWSLDHLYLDQEGIPTFVECKRASNTQIRREIVAQMLDYAANGLKYWTMDRLRQAATETALRRGKTIDSELQRLLQDMPDGYSDTFWQRVEDNLHTGKVRLLFVADRIPAELRRLVEFLNEKLNDIDVLAVEIKQFQGNGEQKVLVPRLIGMTETARDKPSTSKTSRAVFLQSCPPEAAAIFEHMLRFADERRYVIYWGKVGFSIGPTIKGAGTSILYGWPPAYPPTRIEFFTGNIKLPADEVQSIRDQLKRLGIFTLGGRHTYRATITTETAPRIAQALPIVFSMIDVLVSQDKQATNEDAQE